MELIEEFPQEVRDALHKAVRRAYESACNNYQSAKGSNQSTFGTDVYNFAKHELIEASKIIPELIIISDKPTFRLGYKDIEIACHKVGKSARQNIFSAFPHNKCAIGRQIVQLPIPGLDQFCSPEKKCVLAHFGNFPDGFIKAYICVASGLSATGRINYWSYVAELIVSTAIPGALIPDEEIAEVTVEKRSSSVIAASVFEEAHDEVSRQRNIRSKVVEEGQKLDETN